MKKLKLVFLGCLLFVSTVIFSQVSVNVTIGSPPQWGPVGYTEMRYYYLPDIEAYYDVHNSMFIYFTNGGWIHRAYLPRRYRGYDLYKGYKVVMTDYHGNEPFVYFKKHKSKYAKGYHNGNQKSIGQKPGNRMGNSKKRKAQSPPQNSRTKNNSKGKKGQGHGGGHKGHGKK